MSPSGEHPEEVLYLANATVFDGRSVKTRQGVSIRGGSIEWTGSHVRAPRAARSASEYVDLAGDVLTPGLIDCHVHLQFDGSPDFNAEAAALNPALATVKAVANLGRHLEAGVTAVRDLGGLGNVSPVVGRAVAEGRVTGPRVRAAGRALTVTGGHGHSVFAREVDGPDTVRRAVREEIKSGATAIKLVATGGVLTPGIGATFAAFTAEELRAAIDEAHAWGRRVAAHAIGEEGITRAVRAGVDSIEHGCHISTPLAKEMRERGTFRSPTISALRGIAGHPDEVPSYAVEKAMSLLAVSEASHRRAVRAGVRHVCGTDAGTPFNPHGGAPGEVIAMVEWGMSERAAMRAATSEGADLLGFDDTGRIAPGMRADLVRYAVDPLQDITGIQRPRTVWLAGAVVATLD
jgi:imidazolonepropionase-like amidohydrolase